MSSQPGAPGRNIILALAVLVIIWGLFGMADLKNIPYSGFLLGPDDEVIRVDEGGPAAQAGMQVGDQIISIDGILVDDVGASRRHLREEIGETRPVVVEPTNPATGESTTENLSITFTPESGSDVFGWWVGAAIGLVFMICGILVYSRVPSSVTLLFCIVGLCLGALLLPGPYLNSFWVRSFINLVGTLVALTGFGSLLHFLLVFPKRKKILEKPGRTRLVYLPAALLTLSAVFFTMFEGGRGGLTEALGYFWVFLFLCYPVLSVVAIIHSYVKATPEERNQFGLNYVMWSAVLGLVPIILLIVIGLFAPTMTVPGEDFLFITLVLIPVGFALALLKSGKKPAVVL